MNSYNELASLLDKHDSVLVISGKSFEKTNITHKLDLTNSKFYRFSQFSENPCLEAVICALSIFRHTDLPAILAIGGGTAIDIAKLTKYYLNCELTLDVVEPPTTSNKKTSSIPIYVVPTTFGSGSESTSFAVIYVQGKKFSIADAKLLPEYYLLDATLSRSLPLYTKASACLDSLSQAIESYWSHSATSDSKKNAIVAIETISKSFESYLFQPTDEIEQAIAEASNLAGQAINITKTTAPHALSYFISQQYNISHGHAVALCMQNMFKVNEEKANQIADYRLVNTLNEIYGALGVSCAEEARIMYKRFLMKAQLTNSFDDLGLSGNDKVQQAINSVNLERLSNHPIELSHYDLTRIFIDE
ncbi:iron-containing alcohol dehydrogenase [Pseudoalteromonas sp. DL2-H2.2]|uniref:iron-containing alcohol dehydrogenase n=1 Tax=Pseudoalteromonas sp. DL2-H2.2 TaxID=2908889 RepID=UPI001F381452|nr:iron-containing alcohol dehydrogenase [Pseudoalteromonas sp. DL2-H2.2]MCF2909716.1 iron-containing alcohol dehydrogenase [Pseudoalteromonas sp. DL2-H2.2]